MYDLYKFLENRVVIGTRDNPQEFPQNDIFYHFSTCSTLDPKKWGF